MATTRSSTGLPPAGRPHSLRADARGTFVDASGGWHDAGDQLKYLLTASNATARMLLAYELEPTKFDDRVDRLGHPLPNGIPMCWTRLGGDWIGCTNCTRDRMNCTTRSPTIVITTVGRCPTKIRPTTAGGPIATACCTQRMASRRASASTKRVDGLATAGRCAAAMSMAHRIWKRDLNDPVFAARCLQAAHELYALGRKDEGVQQGNSYGAPYRYSETTWADDMEWAAAELFAETGERKYLWTMPFVTPNLAADTLGCRSRQQDTTNTTRLSTWGILRCTHTSTRRCRQSWPSYYRAGIEAT